jgi:hypothetical protein
VRQRVARRIVSATLIAAVATTPALAVADPTPEWRPVPRRFIDRDIVLPEHVIALDVGLGMGHGPADDASPVNRYGMNVEGAVGLTSSIEVGVRTALRFGDEGGGAQPDLYARPFDTETYNAGYDRIANPELRLRGAVAHGAVAALALEVRTNLPIGSDSAWGAMVGLPLRLRFRSIGIDTGLFVPVLFFPRSTNAVILSLPVQVWIQATPTVWFGPVIGLRHGYVSYGGGPSETFNDYSLGLGVGVSLSPAIDLRAWFLIPNLFGDAFQDYYERRYGGGIAMELRFGGLVPKVRERRRLEEEDR